MSFSKYNKVRGKFESLETRQLFAADLVGGAVVDAPATVDSAPVATASDRCDVPNFRLQLGGIANQMSLMQRFSYNGTTMRKNDTTIAGDQYQTDTCHVDEYGTVSMAFKEKTHSTPSLGRVNGRYEGERTKNHSKGSALGRTQLEHGPGLHDSVHCLVGSNPTPHPMPVPEFFEGRLKPQWRSTPVGLDTGPVTSGAGFVGLDTGPVNSGAGLVSLDTGPVNLDTGPVNLGTDRLNLEHGPGLHDSVHCLVGSNPTPHPMPVRGSFQEGLRNQLEHGPGLHDSVHCLVGGTTRTAQRSKGADFAAHPRLVDQAMAENGSPSQADGDVLPGKTAFLPWHRG
jgi:hypothetical protein